MKPRKVDALTLPPDPVAEVLADLYSFLLARCHARLTPSVPVTDPPTTPTTSTITPTEGDHE